MIQSFQKLDIDEQVQLLVENMLEELKAEGFSSVDTNSEILKWFSEGLATARENIAKGKKVSDRITHRFSIEVPQSDRYVLELHLNGGLCRGFSKEKYTLDEAFEGASGIVMAWGVQLGFDKLSIDAGFYPNLNNY